MPPKKNRTLRILVPVGVAVLGLGVAASVLVNSVNQARSRQVARSTQVQQPTTAPGTPSGAASGPASPATEPDEQRVVRDGSRPETDSASTPEAVGQSEASAAPVQGEPAAGTDRPPGAAAPAPGPIPTGLHARPVAAQTFEPLGDLEGPDHVSAFLLRLEFSQIGAGVRSIVLARHYQSVQGVRHKTGHTQVQGEATFTDPTGRQRAYAPMAVISVRIGNQNVNLLGTSEEGPDVPVWEQIEPGVFRAVVVDDRDSPVLSITRRYVLDSTSYDVAIEQELVNLSGVDLTVQIDEFGPFDLPREAVGYGGDKRRVRFGYLGRPAINPSRQVVGATDFLLSRRRVLGKRDKATRRYEPARPIWPNPTSAKKEYDLVWLAMTNRYFGAALHPLVDPGPAPVDKVFHAAERVERLVLNDSGKNVLMALSLTSEPIAIPAGSGRRLDLGLYAGPLKKGTIAGEPVPAKVGLDRLVAYNFGGMCAVCTFPFITSSLIGLLRFLHEYVVFDYALAIIMLVVIVRTMLHPVTRWSQIRMQRFGKQMQAMGPKQKKIQERYKDDRKKLQEEMGKLWREEGINPAGMLGCLPMFLQTPVWIALYATLYFAFELRHQQAFFGLFQAISGWKWLFLADLSEPDRFIYFGRTIVTLPMLGPISSINVLPFLLAAVFFVHQKYLTPPTSASTTPEQEQQQKIMRVMMVVMFPVIMYNAPSGLALYFICNSSLGIIESRMIRSHAEKHGLLDAKGSARRASPGGFLARLQQRVEQQKKTQAMARRGPPARGAGRGGGGAGRHGPARGGRGQGRKRR